MDHTIENELLSLTVSSHGAELYDLRRKAAPDVLLLWDGKPEFWPRRAPILFPWCSKIEDPDFMCIEPWSGNGGPGHDLAQRPGTVLIPPGGTFTRAQRLHIHIL